MHPNAAKPIQILVVSSYGIPCGIAQYAEHLVPVLETLRPSEYKIEVAALDVRLLKTHTRTARKLAKQHLHDIVEKAKSADVVNIQLEPGLFGSAPFEIRRRLKKLLDASPKVIITHHTVLDLRDAVWSIPWTRRQLYSLARNFTMVYVLGWLYRYCRVRQDKFFHVLQTRMDERALTLLGISASTIAAQPLSFLSESAVDRSFDAAKTALPKLPEDAVVIGAFGFLSSYKGFEVVIRALDLLPNNFHLVIVGGVHPEGVVEHSTQQPYIEQLLSEIHPKDARFSGRGAIKMARRRLARIHFLGHLDNDRFSAAMAGCDVVVLPYAEVGQRSSGPASMAIDLNKRILCSRTICFSQLNAYAGALELFEIGNHAELAEKLQCEDRSQRGRQLHLNAYNIRSRADLYRHAAEQLLAKGR